MGMLVGRQAGYVMLKVKLKPHLGLIVASTIVSGLLMSMPALADTVTSDPAGSLSDQSIQIDSYKYPMVDVTGGCFDMGSLPSAFEWRLNERRHRICVEDFSIGKYEVTEHLWMMVLGVNPSGNKFGGDYPVEQVSVKDIERFVDRLNQMTGKNYRLPTEAEWEYACRSGGKEEKYCGRDDIEQLAWYVENSGSTKQVVGGKQPNGLGLYDMSGNVWEWTCSIYSDNYAGAETDCASSQDVSPRVTRGGSFNLRPAYVRSAYRYRSDPFRRRNFVGFRLALDQ
ncbi:MAG: hypothetical protein DHS20C01_23920 [marine bacterium B5-7]|nr:MAG: hypothetical protein DHS20C01_23920 [marine bacterium B5-7]